MKETFARTQRLIGDKALEKLFRSRVAVFGVGGVGGYVCEALVRSGIGAFDLIDKDEVSRSNLNRQIIATTKTVGRKKVDVMRERMLEINPEVKVQVYPRFFLPENASEFPFEEYDYVVDAVDTVTAKIEIIMRAKECGVPVISAMGAGNKMDPSMLQVADIYKTKVCPLAKVMRQEMKKRRVKKLKVVYSEEPARKPLTEAEGGPPLEADEIAAGESGARRRISPGSNSFVPSSAGLLIASEVIKDLTMDLDPNYQNV